MLFRPPLFFFFNHTPTPDISTLSLRRSSDLSCSRRSRRRWAPTPSVVCSTRSIPRRTSTVFIRSDRKSTRLNSSHLGISYAVFCLKKKKKKIKHLTDYKTKHTDQL